MNIQQWEIFCSFKQELKEQIEIWKKSAPELTELQKAAALEQKTPVYPFETTVVYNRALDDITPQDNIKLIVIGDNPGKDEQLAKNNRYLVGQAGKIAEGYFKKNPELGVNFRKNVIILNKTPVHSAKTSQLKAIAKKGGPKIAELIKESQIWMAKKTAKLHTDLSQAGTCKQEKETELWLVGYSELKPKGIFEDYRTILKETYFLENAEVWNKVYVFQHFSMNRFSIDLSDYEKQNKNKGSTLEENIHKLGIIHREEIFKHTDL